MGFNGWRAFQRAGFDPDTAYPNVGNEPFGHLATSGCLQHNLPNLRTRC